MDNLLTNFEIISKEAWKEQIQKDLKGTRFEDLQSQDRNKCNINPFYTKEDLPSSIQALFSHSDWRISTQISVKKGKEKSANAQALEELKNGVQSIEWIISEKLDWQVLFQEIQLDIIQTFIRIENCSITVNEDIDKYWDTYYAGKSKEDFIEILYDPIQNTILFDIEYINTKDTLYIQGHDYSHLGLNTSEQIAYILGNLQEQLHLRKKAGTLEQVKKMYISYANGLQFFEEISKNRALYQLVPLILKKYELEIPFYFLAETALYYLTAEDSPNNILRNTIAGLSAVLGGCHTLYIHPHKSELFQKEIDARRIARNQQHLFKEESYFHKIADASHGSYTIESRTSEIAEKAWELFLSIEENGGILKDKNNFIEKVQVAQKELLEASENGSWTLIGYNKHLLEEEAILPVFENKQFANNLQYFQLPLKK